MKEIKKNYSNSNFIAIGLGQEFAQNTPAWKKLKRLSQIANQSD
jgi:hypothetical protein